MIYLILIPLFFIIFVEYLKIADRFNIIDKPNQRSSHTQVTIRGGGVIYLVAALAALGLHPNMWMPVLSLFIIGIISFVDDRFDLSNRLRLIFHLAAVAIILYNLKVATFMPWWGVGLLFVVVIGVINAYNFMDGINGITGAYSLVILGGLQYVNIYVHSFIYVDMIWLPILATFIFLFFNFRVKARCFAGDVGSITVALWIIFLLLTLMIKTGDLKYILFFSVYGVDSVFTIIHRLILRQNIFEAHRLHFYQILANEKKISQLTVSIVYAFIQMLIITMIVMSTLSFISLFFLSVFPLSVIYMIIKPKLMTS